MTTSFLPFLFRQSHIIEYVLHFKTIMGAFLETKILFLVGSWSHRNLFVSCICPFILMYSWILLYNNTSKYTRSLITVSPGTQATVKELPKFSILNDSFHWFHVHTTHHSYDIFLIISSLSVSYLLSSHTSNITD